MGQLVRQYVLPACYEHQARVADSVAKVTALDVAAARIQKEELGELVAEISGLVEATRRLERFTQEVREEADLEKRAQRTAKELRGAMAEVRDLADRLEGKVERSLWPLPSYVDLLFRH